MSDETKDEAKQLAERAATQAKHAGRNSVRAVETAAEPVVEEVVKHGRTIGEKLLNGSAGLFAISGGVVMFAAGVRIFRDTLLPKDAQS